MRISDWSSDVCSSDLLWQVLHKPQDIVQFYQLRCARNAHYPHIMKASAETPLRPRLGGHILVDQLLAQGTEHVFCVPGESYVAVLDGLHDAAIQVTVCRQEGGAAMMADAYGKLTGKPGICMVTRGPGATMQIPDRKSTRLNSSH